MPLVQVVGAEVVQIKKSRAVAIAARHTAIRRCGCAARVAAIYSRSLDTHIKRLRPKFRAVEETFNEIDTVHGAGYRFSRGG